MIVATKMMSMAGTREFPLPPMPSAGGVPPVGGDAVGVETGVDDGGDEVGGEEVGDAVGGLEVGGAETGAGALVGELGGLKLHWNFEP